MIPPTYEIVASINKNNQGLVDFEAQSIKTSGGIMHTPASEAKKNENINVEE